jgi:NAD+ kinase
MRIALFSKSFPSYDTAFIQEIVHLLEAREAGLMFYEPFFNKIHENVAFRATPQRFNSHDEIAGKADYLLSIGGDGTLLDTISLVRDSGIPILGINLGRMGFLSSIAKDRIGLALEKLFQKRYTLDQRVLIRVESSKDLFGKMNYALNEVSIYRKSPLSMLKIEAHVDDEFLNAYWADGLIVSTPTGSTAYSLSNGGPIILPGSSNFVITPIATHNLTVRPIVIPDSSKIRINVVGRISEFHINLDSRSVLTDNSVEFMIKKEDFKINLLQLEGESYFKTIREKLMWGLDIRN